LTMNLAIWQLDATYEHDHFICERQVIISKA
jgi:hypothetical protein